MLREVYYRESDKILTVLTEDEGRLTVSARGARSRNSKIAAAAQLFAFSELVLYERQGKLYLREGRTVELFSGLRQDIIRLAMAAYFAQVLETVSDEDIPNPAVLSLGLNSLYLLSRALRAPDLIKAAFELRLMCLAGYAPRLDACPLCGSEPPREPHFSLQGGFAACRDCLTAETGPHKALCAASLAAMRHIVSAPPERVFSFSLEPRAAKRLGKVAEAYCQAQLERSFQTLDYLKRL